MENPREYSRLIVLLTVLGALLLGARAQEQQISLVGSDVTLVPQYTGELQEIIWWINTTIMVEMKLNPLKVFTFKLPRDRFSINENNGALTIINLNINDSGNYTAEVVLKNNTVHKTEITLAVHEPSVPNKWVIVGVVIPFAVIALEVLCCVFYKISRKIEKIRQRNSAMPRAGLLD